MRSIPLLASCVLLATGCLPASSSGDGGSEGSSSSAASSSSTSSRAGSTATSPGASSATSGSSAAGGSSSSGSASSMSGPGSSSAGSSSGSSGEGGSSSGGSSSGGLGSSSGGPSSGGSSSSGGSGAACPPALAGTIDVTLTSVGVHPAAAAALAALGLTPPSLAGYTVDLDAVTLKGGSPFTTVVGSVTLTAANETGPITFCNVNLGGGIASLGVLSAIVTTSGPATPPTCAELTSGGFTDSYVNAANQVYFGTPTADITDGVAFALPASYVSALDCAAGLVPGSSNDLLNGGFSLLYASQNAAAAGAPLAGVTFNNLAASFLYYPAGYAAGSATASGPTTATGIATVTGVVGLATVTASDPAAGTFNSRDLSTPAGDAYMVFYAPGT